VGDGGEVMRSGGIAIRAALALVVLAVAGLWAAPAHAAPATDPNENINPCLDGVRVRSFTATPATVDYGKSTTLRWDVSVPPNCPQLKFDLTPNQPVRPQGSLEVTPIANVLRGLHASWAGRSRRRIATLPLKVTLPANLEIGANHLAPTLAQALGTPGITIKIPNHVQLDLSYWLQIPVAAGVTLIGARTASQGGPLIHTRADVKPLLLIKGDGVRITGMRIRGPDPTGIPGSGTAVGIRNDSYTNLEIDHNELYGWKGSAVEIRDNKNRISHLAATPTVRIHDNWIHHNQRTLSFGYGVVISDGSYALIERNVFDWNRHAIAGDGSDYSGYRAYDNLVLQNGGRHRWIRFLGWFHTHQFDMHGQRNCGVANIWSDSLYNCGRAGYDMDIRYNSFLYTSKAAIKLRGTPQRKPCGAVVDSNVFAHLTLAGAVKQTESGLCKSNNQVRVNSLKQQLRCDVNGDGKLDSFLATGQTWWYAWGGTRPWVFVKRDRTRPTSCPPPSS
jgi:parallel beta helix pectate lyase-like protein